MAERTLGNAWANVRGAPGRIGDDGARRREPHGRGHGAARPLRDVRDNQRAAYDRPEWQSVFLVEGIAGADEPMSNADVAALRRTPGVTGVWPFGTVDADAGGALVQLRSWVAALDVPIVVGRAPEPGACEAAVTRSVTDATVGAPLDVSMSGGGARRSGGASPSSWGSSTRATPSWRGRPHCTTCPLPSTQAPEQLAWPPTPGACPNSTSGSRSTRRPPDRWRAARAPG